MCPCKLGEQTIDHLIYHCKLLKSQRETLRQEVIKTGKNWPTTDNILISECAKSFYKFLKSIDFEKLK